MQFYKVDCKSIELEEGFFFLFTVHPVHHFQLQFKLLIDILA